MLRVAEVVCNRKFEMEKDSRWFVQVDKNGSGSSGEHDLDQGLAKRQQQRPLK